MPPGRPRSFDPDQALDAALAVFWERGHAAATLDALCAAMGMNRPSVYAAFGDKDELYARALARFTSRLRDHGEASLAHPRLQTALEQLYTGLLGIYTDAAAPRGCLVFSVAVVQAPTDPVVREAVCRGLTALDAALTARFARAVDDGELPGSADVQERAWLAAAVLHSLSLRVRAGEALPSLHEAALRQARRLAQQACPTGTGEPGPNA